MPLPVFQAVFTIPAIKGTVTPAIAAMPAMSAIGISSTNRVRSSSNCFLAFANISCVLSNAVILPVRFIYLLQSHACTYLS